MKSILFVINTMGVGGGEKALLELLKRMDFKQYKVSLLVLTGQGELINQLPKEINLLNKCYSPISVLNRLGKIRLIKTVVKTMFTRGTILKRLGYILSNLKDMIKQGEIKKDKLFWKILSDGAQRLDVGVDLAVAYLEGASAYYVADYVTAKKKVAFIHIDYSKAGYNRKLDEDCYLYFDQIFTVSESARKAFIAVYPECKDRTQIFYDLIDRENIICSASKKGGFSDNYQGYRILTVGRLVPQKALDVAIDTMKILKASDKPFRWYVLGEGELRKKLEKQIHNLGLEKDFILLGTVDNPFPYYAQCDLYVHTAYFEGKGSIALEEAQVLGCAVVASEHSGVWEQVKDGVDGMVCKLNPKMLAEGILDLVDHPNKMASFALAASKREQIDYQKEIRKLVDLIE